MPDRIHSNKLKNATMPNVPLIVADGNDSDAIGSIITAIKNLQTDADKIFRNAEERLNACLARISSYNNRMAILECKVEAVKNSDVIPTLFASSKYPETSEGLHDVVYQQLPSFTPYYASYPVEDQSNTALPIPVDPLHIIHKSVACKNNYQYAFKLPKFMESCSSACVEEKTPKSCISCEKESIPHDRRGTKRSESPETSESLLVHCEFGSTSVTDPFNYKPEIGNLSTFDLPDELPDLPGGLKGITFNDDSSFFEPIAPSVSFSIKQKKHSSTASNVDLSVRSSFYQTDDQQSLFFDASSRKPSLSARSVTSQQHSNAPLGRKDADLFKSSLEHINTGQALTSINTKEKTTKEEAAEVRERVELIGVQQQMPSETSVSPAPNIPPPPPPPLPLNLPSLNIDVGAKLPSDVSKAHCDLMESIRAVGGTRNARLKKISTAETQDKSTDLIDPSATKKAPPVDSGDDLMSSLAKALEMRRKGISGKQSTKKFAAFDNKDYGKKPIHNENETFSRLRQVIPPPPPGTSLSRSDDDCSDHEEWS